jgi:Peptidase M76 family
MTHEPIPSPRLDGAAAAATSATSIRSSSSSINDVPKQSPECTSCIRLLQHVLSNTDSKPARLLQSMSLPMATVTTTNAQEQQQQQLLFQPTPNGVIVQIPVEQKAPNNTTETASGMPSNNTLPTSEPLLRRFTRGWNTTNSSTSTTTTTASPTAVSPVLATSLSTWHKPQLAIPTPVTEGMSLQCRHCGSTGPEGNARAFVMGPTPLSIVVCHNRLQHNGTPKSSFFAPFSSHESNAAATTDSLPKFSKLAEAEMSEILTHELTHIYDVRQLHLDLTSCHDLAYSEVRAAREAECASLTAAAAATTAAATDTSSPFMFSSSSSHNYRNNAQKECVQSTATAATHNLFALKQAQSCVQSVLDRAYADHRPFSTTSGSSSSSSRPLATTTLETSDRTTGTAPVVAAAASKSELPQTTPSAATTTSVSTRRQASHVSER